MLKASEIDQAREAALLEGEALRELINSSTQATVSSNMRDLMRSQVALIDLYVAILEQRVRLIREEMIEAKADRDGAGGIKPELRRGGVDKAP